MKLASKSKFELMIVLTFSLLVFLFSTTSDYLLPGFMGSPFGIVLAFALIFPALIIATRIRSLLIYIRKRQRSTKRLNRAS